ncbi:MAG: hypothetical protein M5U30_04070 [Burkholderiaceae bacterium]|nr:hypothetical protein [Burkholderiaceae bacterium]
MRRNARSHSAEMRGHIAETGGHDGPKYAHKAVAGQYQSLRNQARIFREIELLDGMEPEKAKTRLFAIAEARDELNQRAPAPARGDYELAKQDIDGGRARYRRDEAKP